MMFVFPTSRVQTDAFSINYRPTSPQRFNTALSMNLFDRFQRVAKANLNNILQNLEDPEKIMSQALEDMQVRLSSFAPLTAAS